MKILLCLIFSIFYTNVLAGEFEEQFKDNIERGEFLHSQKNCLACHKEIGYHKSKSKDFVGIIERVARCNKNLKIGLWGDEILDVSSYLNSKYYH